MQEAGGREHQPALQPEPVPHGLGDAPLDGVQQDVLHGLGLPVITKPLVPNLYASVQIYLGLLRQNGFRNWFVAQP